MSDLLVLVGCDGGELSLREGEGVDAVCRQRHQSLCQAFRSTVLNNVNAWPVLVHGLQDYLNSNHIGRI